MDAEGMAGLGVGLAVMGIGLGLMSRMMAVGQKTAKGAKKSSSLLWGGFSKASGKGSSMFFK